MLFPDVSPVRVLSSSCAVFGAKLTLTSSFGHRLPSDVGNKAAVFPLQLLGFEVDIVNSVHFSNHTGYPKGWEGDVLKGDQLRQLLNGLERNGLLQDIQHVLTGYIGSESFLTEVMDDFSRSNI